MTEPPRPTRPPLTRLVWRHWIVGPLLYGLSAFVLTVAGRGRQLVSLRRRWVDSTVSPPGPDRPSLATLPLSLLALVVTLIGLTTVYTGELYPLRPDAIGHLGAMFTSYPGGEDAWGGPSLIGAWFVHALVGAGLQAIALAVIRGLAALSARIGD